MPNNVEDLRFKFSDTRQEIRKKMEMLIETVIELQQELERHKGLFLNHCTLTHKELENRVSKLEDII